MSCEEAVPHRDYFCINPQFERLKVSDPALAESVQYALEHYIIPGTSASYRCAWQNYERFCSNRDITPYPVQGIIMAAWILRLMTSIQPLSVKNYIAGVRYSQINKGFEWTLKGDESMRRVIRVVKRKEATHGWRRPTF